MHFCFYFSFFSFSFYFIDWFVYALFPFIRFLNVPVTISYHFKDPAHIDFNFNVLFIITNNIRDIIKAIIGIKVQP